jgi:hypothetical protein
MDEFVEKVLIEYVKDQYLDRKKNAEIVIRKFCSNQPPLSITVYRGHGNTDDVIRPGLWYSASTDRNIATDEFAGPDCCVFIIHLLDVPCIDINHFIGDKIGDKIGEKEIIFLGGGTFYKNNELTEEGYLELEMGELSKRTFECWYSLSKSQHITQPKMQSVINNVERALSIIDPEEEYEFITSIDDIIVDMSLSNEEKQQVLNEIKKRKVKGGEKITNLRNTKKNRKRKRKRKSKSKSKSKIKRSKTLKNRRLKCKKV